MDYKQAVEVYLASKRSIDKKIADNKGVIRAQIEYISIVINESIFDFNTLETRLDDIIFKEYILDNARLDSNVFDLGLFKEEVLRGGFIDFIGKVRIVNQIAKRRKIIFNKKVFLDFAGLRNNIAHGLQNFDSEEELGLKICLYGRKMKRIDFVELGKRFEMTLKKANSELDVVYHHLGMIVVSELDRKLRNN